MCEHLCLSLCLPLPAPDCCCCLPHSFIGTAPEARGRGLGSRLLAEITSRADREGRWCLLEATSEKSEVSHELRVYTYVALVLAAHGCFLCVGLATKGRRCAPACETDAL
jgi:GNAT superfamily N-acetyltransferase